MDLKFFCPRWGSEHLSWDSFCQQVRAAGYDGVETGVSFQAEELREMKTALRKYDLLLVGQYWQSLEKDFDSHKASFEKHLYRLAELQPLRIDAQTGKDYFSFDQNKELFNLAFAFTRETGIEVAHETHRNKALFAAHVCKDYLLRIPDLHITADFSHWCNVAESFLEDQAEALAIAASRSIHIHARVGHPQSAQVTDPRLPEWQHALQHHLNWWQQIINHQQRAGASLLSITPEFGPPPYMPCHPGTNQPLANQWELNTWMMGLLNERFRSRPI